MLGIHRGQYGEAAHVHVLDAGRVVSEADALTDQPKTFGFDQHEGGQVVGDQALHAGDHLVDDLVEVEGLGDCGCGVAECFGVGALLPFLRLETDPVLDFAAEALVGLEEFAGSLPDTLIQLAQGGLQPLLGPTAIRDVGKGAEHADDFAGEVPKRHLVGLQPAVLAGRATELFNDSELRLAGFDDDAVPVQEPVRGKVAAVRPWHVPIRHADQDVRLDPSEAGKHLVAAEVAGLVILPEHGAGHRVHEDLEHLLAGRQSISAADLSSDQRGVHGSRVGLRGSHVGRALSLRHGARVRITCPRTRTGA